MNTYRAGRNGVLPSLDSIHLQAFTGYLVGAQPWVTAQGEWLLRGVLSWNNSSRKQSFRPQTKMAQSPWISCSMWTSLRWCLCRIWFMPLRLIFFFLLEEEDMFCDRTFICIRCLMRMLRWPDHTVWPCTYLAQISWVRVLGKEPCHNYQAILTFGHLLTSPFPRLGFCAPSAIWA